MTQIDFTIPGVPEIRVQLRAAPLSFPMIADGLLLGQHSPIGCMAWRRALSLLVADPFEHIELPDDEVLSDLFIRRSILLKAPRERLLPFILRHVKPLMTDTEVMHLHLTVEAILEGQV